MTSSRPSDRLAREVLVGDGGMGSLLASRLPRLRFPEEVTSHALALRLHHEVPGISVPQPVLARLAGADARAAAEGVAITRDLLTGAHELAAGAYLVTPFGQPERVLDVLA